MRRLAPLTLLLLLSACQFKRQEAPAIYAPWEEGTTLGYENPSLPTFEARRESRYQVHVVEGLMDPTRAGLIKLTRSSLQVAPVPEFLRVEAGGIEHLKEDGTHLDWMLPKGFPDQVSQWRDSNRNLDIRVIGPAAWDNPARIRGLFDPIGVWIEITGPDLRQRALLLRGLGQVELLAWRDGGWVTVSRLVDAGKTDDRFTGK